MTSPEAKLSIYVENFAARDPGNWRYLVDWAIAAEGAGIDRMAISDHVVFGEHLEVYANPSRGGIEGGEQPTGPDGPWLEPLTTIAYLSGLTTHLTFVTRILLAALRRPVVLAKMASTIDVLSGGRLELGVGVGWQREEYDAAGVPFERRGAALDESLEICERLWREECVTYRSESLHFDRIHQMPKPSRPEGIPIWVSGTVNRGAMDRLARYGSGWIPWGRDAFDVVGGIQRMGAAMTERSRDPAGIGVTTRLPIVRDDRGSVVARKTMEPVAALRQAGVTDFCLSFGLDQRAEQVGEQLGELVAAFRTVVGDP